MTFIRLLLVLSVISGTEALHAQSATPPPNFSGRWFIDKATLKPSAMRPYWPVCGWECTIAHTATGLTVTPATGAAKTFVIGGPPVAATIEGFGQVTTQTTSARWEQQQLVITVITGAGDEFTSTTRLALDASRLVVTTTRGGGRGSGQETAIYLRKQTNARLRFAAVVPSASQDSRRLSGLRTHHQLGPDRVEPGCINLLPVAVGRARVIRPLEHCY